MKKRLISLLLTVAMLLTLVVVPTNAALVAGTGTLTITPNVTSVPGSASAPIEVIYTIKVTPPAEGPVGEFHFNLKAPDGMTLSEVKLKPQAGNKGGDGYWVNMNDLWYNPTTEEGVFETFEYTPASKYFQAFGTSASRNMTAEADIMTIKATIAAGKVGDFTLTAENVGINKDGTDSYSVDVKTTPVTVVSSISGNLTVTIAKPVVNQEPVTSLTDTQYSGTITWDPAVTSGGKFAASTVYTANVTLTAKDGYQFANGVNPTVAGATISNVSADGTKLTFKAKFDATGNLTPASVTAVPTAKTGLEYNGTKQVLLGSLGTASGGDMQYSLDNISWSDATPTGKDAKTYTVYYKVKGDSSHSDSAVANIQVTIGQKDISGVTIGTIADQPYTGSAITPDIVVKDGTTPLVKDKDYTVSCADKYVGTATLTITGKGNYTGTKNANFTITAVNQNPTFTTPKDLVKGGHKLDLRTLVQGAKGEMTFTIAPGTTSATLSGYTLTSTGIKGEVKVSVSITAKDMNGDTINEYNAFSKSEAITVNVVDKTSDTATMKVSQGDITYGESVSPSVTNNPDGTDTVSYTYEGRDGTTYSSSATAPTNVGKYKVTAKCESPTTIYTAEANFDIQPKSIRDMTVTLNKTSLEYNGSAQSVTVTGVGSLTTADYTVTGATSGTNVGNYTVTVAGKGNYTGSVEKTWKITPATLTVTGATVAAKIYDGSTDATVSAVTFSGTKGSDALTVGTDYTVSGVFNSANVNDANNVIVTVTLKDTTLTKNYKLASSTYNQAATISQAPTPAAPTGLTGIKGNLLNTVALPTGWTWVNGTQKMEEAGVDKPFGAHYEDPNGNYAPNISGTPVLITVLAKNDVNTKITFPNGSLVYNGNGQKYEKASISGITASGTAEWTYTYAVDPSTATATLDSGLPLTVGKYTVTATYEDSANYGTATATLEITPAKPTVTPKFDKITEKGKTLANANLTIASSSPVGGKIEWVDDAGAVLPGTTTVEANKAYKWRYTPLDTTNYAPVYGTIVVYPTSTGIVVYCPHYTIKASAGANGTISPAGWCSVAENGSQTFTFTPDKGYSVAKVLVDGKSVGAVKSYTFKDVTKDHTIEVIFMKSNGNPATGVFVMP